MKSILISLVVLSFILSMVEAQSNPHYTVTDPAIEEMLTAIDMPRYTGSVPAVNIAGNWQLALSDGEYIELALLQSGLAVYGKGKMAIGTVSQEAFAGGSITGSLLRLEVVPESGTELYAVSVDISRLPFAGTYAVFTAGSAPQTGTVRASKNTSYG